MGAIEIGWENDDKTIFLWKLQGSFTWQELEQAQRRAMELHAQADRPFTTLMDLTGVTQLPSVMSHFPELSNQVPQHETEIIAVSHNFLVATFGRIFSKLYAHPIHMVRTLDEGYALIRERARARS